jgi:hypothetical protein
MVSKEGNKEPLGAYYLHANGDLIWKLYLAFADDPSEYFEGGFVVKYWIIPSSSPTGSPEGDVKWTMDWLYESLQLSGNKERTELRIRQICEANKFDKRIAKAIIARKITNR